jgi:hypothetical protein
MDPGPSSASADPSPPEEEEEEEEEEGGSSSSRWVVVPGSEVLGADAPKVVGWEELQQELARLWSLSAALAAARDRKAGLAARLESALQVLDFYSICLSCLLAPSLVESSDPVARYALSCSLQSAHWIFGVLCFARECSCASVLEMSGILPLLGLQVTFGSPVRTWFKCLYLVT